MSSDVILFIGVICGFGGGTFFGIAATIVAAELLNHMEGIDVL